MKETIRKKGIGKQHHPLAALQGVGHFEKVLALHPFKGEIGDRLPRKVWLFWLFFRQAP